MVAVDNVAFLIQVNQQGRKIMGLFDFVEFGPEEVKAVANGTADRRTVIAIMTSQTCGEACWHAREEVCRCSCGGKNHGCLSHGGQRPERTSRIDGHLYKLQAVGLRSDIYGEAERINREAGFSYVQKPHLVIGCTGVYKWTQADIDTARAEGKEVWFSQYYGTWRETDCGAPARIKNPTGSQRNWQELSGWKDNRDVALLWVRVQMPQRPTELKVDRDGVVLANQNPE